MQPLLGAVRALAGALEQFDDAAAQTLGVGRSDLRALNLLEVGALPAGVLAARLGLSSGATTALVDGSSPLASSCSRSRPRTAARCSSGCCPRCGRRSRGCTPRAAQR